MGGGFVLRTAGSANGALFQRFVLIAPFLDPRAATSKPNEGAAGWAQSDVARIIGITLLRRVGIACCDHLPVIAYALPAGSALHATGQYSYALLTTFGAGLDHRVYLDKVRKPVTVIAGAQDELMFADRYAETMKRPGLDLKVSVMPGVDHMGVLADTAAVDAIVAAVKSGNGA